MAEPEEFADFGLWVKGRRETLRMTQAELGELIGYAADTIRKIEAGSRRPSVEMVERLIDHLRVEPEYQDSFRLRARDKHAFLPTPHGPRPTGASHIAHRLPPAALPGLVGREDLLASVGRELRSPDVRLLTLVGPPGVGKTRLARELGLALQPELPHGACWVGVASVRSVDRLITSIAQALRLTLSPERAPLRQLIDYLRPLELLVVLDNVEQLRAVEGLALTLTELVAEVPGLKLLLTSQAALLLSIEHIRDVPPLPSESAGEALSVISDSPAVQLFVQRASAINSSFALTAHNAATVAAICHELDGLPLAIELAAARCRILPPDTLLKRLDQRLDILQSQGGDRDRRHHSLQAALDWSVSLLSAEEQALLAALTVFHNGFTLAAAEAICAAPSSVVLQGIEQLVRHSLLRRVSAEEAEPRFAMLESIRIFAATRLTAEEERRLHTAHAAFFLEYVQRGAPLWGQDAAAWVLALAPEEGNINAALARSHSGEDAVTLGRYVLSLTPYWVHQGPIVEGRRWAELAVSWRQRVPDLEPGLLLAAADLAYQQSDYEAAGRCAAEALAAAAAAAQITEQIRALYRLAWVATRQGAHQGALAHLERAIALARKGSDLRGEAMARLAVGWIAGEQGDVARAQKAQQQSLVLYRQLGDTLSVAYTLNALGWLARGRGSLAEAEQLHTESLRLYRRAGQTSGVAQSMNNLGWVAGMRGDTVRAAQLLTESLELREALGDNRGRAWALSDLGWLWREAGQLAQAAHCYALALQIYQTLGDRRGIALTEVGIAQVTVAQGDLPKASHSLTEAAVTLIEIEDSRGFARVLEVGAALALRESNPLRAAELLGAAEALRDRVSVVLPASEQRWHAELVDAVRSDATAGIADAWARGRARPLSAVIVGLVPTYLTIQQDIWDASTEG